MVVASKIPEQRERMNGEKDKDERTKEHAIERKRTENGGNVGYTVPRQRLGVEPVSSDRPKRVVKRDRTRCRKKERER